ncbi:MAG: hypothetical protein ACRDDJ_03365 [[Mycobacterium] stephanolepidis]
MSVGTLVRAAALFGRKLPASSGSRRAAGTVSARHLLDAISHSDKHIGDLYVGGL